jgi:hypothetical protein
MAEEAAVVKKKTVSTSACRAFPIEDEGELAGRRRV